jgi:chromosome segregation ATPase
MKKILFLLPFLFASCSSHTNSKTAKNDALMHASMAISEAQMDINDVKNELKNLKVQYFGFDKKIESYLTTLNFVKEQISRVEKVLTQIDQLEEKLATFEASLKEHQSYSEKVQLKLNQFEEALDVNCKKVAQLEDTFVLSSEKIKQANAPSRNAY